MRVFAYCCASFAEATRRAAGVRPLLSPPFSAGSFDPRRLEGHDLLYFDLHGEPGQDYWLGDQGVIALLASQVLEVDLQGAVVFATNCYLADEGSPMMDALLAAGARYVIGGEGQNWANTKRPTGAALLGKRLRQLMLSGVEPLKALAIAKRWLVAGTRAREVLGKEHEVMADKDTLAFRAYTRRT
jgi:hypothetical protein